MAMQTLPPAAGGNGTCRHHWVIGEARGEISEGRCLHCGESREFTNWMPSLRLLGGDVEKSRVGGKRKGGGANSYNYIPVLREYEGRIW